MGKDKPEVLIEDVKIESKLDDKAVKDAPKQAAAAIESGLGSKVEVVRGKPEKGFILRPKFELEFSEKDLTLFGKLSVVVTRQDKSMLGTESSKTTLKKVEADGLKAKVQKLAELLGADVGKNCAATIQSEAK